jgi:hypothetical protein
MTSRVAQNHELQRVWQAGCPITYCGKKRRGEKHNHMHGAALTVLLEGELAEKKTAPPNRPSDAFPQ